MKKYMLLAVSVFVAFSLGYGAVADAWPVKGRDRWHGYFTNDYDPYGADVWSGTGGPSGCRADDGNAIPTTVNTKAEFIAYVKCRINGSDRDRIGAYFIIQTMRGSDKTNPPTSAQIADWEDRINNPAVTVSWGTQRSYTINSYYQGTGTGSNPNDDAFYEGSGSGLSIVFHYDGEDAYVLRRSCANPTGDGKVGALPRAPEFTMSGQTTVNGGTSAEVLPGDTVQFRHSLTNAGPDETDPDDIDWRILDQNGNITDTGSASTFDGGETKTLSNAAENFVVPADAEPGTQYCRRVRFTPETEDGGVGYSTLRCATVKYDFDLEPRINVVIRDLDGQDVTADGVAEPGFTIEFSYSVRNTGLTQSQSTTCTYRQDTNTGYDQSSPTTTFTPTGANCPPARTFSSNSTTTTATETVSAASVNTTICRSLTISPVTSSGDSATKQSCVPVVAKPYTRVYGGDVSVGNGLATDPGICSPNVNGSAVGWNRRSAGGYAGAGGQYGIMALDTIVDFTSALGNSGGASKPSGLAFANTGVDINTSSGLFGGSFGSLPCITDYYSQMPDDVSTTLSPVLDAYTTGSYSHSGTLTIGGNINPGENVAIYVDGDVFINDDITFPGSWNSSNMPNFRLIVRGNIYIGNNVDRIDGMYVAQAENGTGGQIHTCATSATPLDLGGDLYDLCNRKLTINGAFVADQVRLLRTSGTLSQSNANDSAPGGGAAAEVFNYNPVLWINQPEASTDDSGDYDAILTLPPVL